MSEIHYKLSLDTCHPHGISVLTSICNAHAPDRSDRSTFYCDRRTFIERLLSDVQWH